METKTTSNNISERFKYPPTCYKEDMETIKLNCKRCKRKWEYKGKSEYYATCPQCLNKVNVRKARAIAQK